MVRRPSLSNKWLIFAVACVALLGVVALASIYSPNLSLTDKPQQADATPAARAIAYAKPNTPEPTLTLTPTSTLTPTPESTSTLSPEPTQTATSTPSATPTLSPLSHTPAGMATAFAKALQPTPDPDILPNGVRYGDRTPNLPHRLVRIASPDVKLDARVYEVYATADGLWEVADYAAGHNYTSMNPGEGGNIVLSGHNNWRGEVFRYLEFLKPGNTINVWTLEGKEYTYKVQTVEKLKEAGAPMAERLEHGKVMDPTPTEQLTLITCWPYTTYTHRLIVVAMPAQ